MSDDAAHLKETDASGVLFVWSYPREALENSIKAGCPLCKILEERFRNQFSKSAEADTEELQLRMRMDVKDSILGIRPEGGEKDFLSFELLADPGMIARTLEVQTTGQDCLLRKQR